MAAETHTTLTPDTPVRYLKGVGPKTAERFEKLGIVTLADLLCHYPRRYLDFSKPYSIAEAPSDTECVVKAEVFAKPGGRILPGGRRMERITAGDDVSSLEITWFNNPYATQKLELGQEYYFQGIVTGGMLRRQMVNPQVRTAEQIKASPFEAVYPQTEGLTSNAIAKCVRQLLPHAELLPDPLPPEMLAKYRLLSKADAVRAIHCPATEEEAFAARRRLIYEELLVLIEKLMQIHAGYFGWSPTLTENDLVDFLKIEFGRVGADTHLTPREVIRDFIELLDILCQNPDANVAELLQSVGGDALAPTAATGDTGTAGGDRNFAEFTI